MDTTDEDTVDIRGRVVTGLGKGRIFLNKEKYREQFVDNIGIDPVIGTLNLSLVEKEKLDILKASKGIPIEGFVESGVKYGSVKAFRAELDGLEAAAILPARSDHKNILEIISEHHLRKELDLKDDDQVTVKIFIS